MEDLMLGDFDFTITDVITAHKCRYENRREFTRYKRGRGMSGIVYCISGSGEYTFKDGKLMLRAGDMIYLPCTSAYTIKSISEFSHITVNFNITPHDQFGMFEKDGCSPGTDALVRDSHGIEDNLFQLLKCFDEKKAGYRVRTKSYLYDILYVYFSHLQKKHRSADYEKIKPAKRMIDEGFKSDISVAELANACGFSVTHFRRVFKSAIGISPTDYRMRRKLTLAKELLEMSELTVSEIATEVGFDDANYFSRVFKSTVGVKPSEYRYKEE